jgi:hypothetical protein
MITAAIPGAAGAAATTFVVILARRAFLRAGSNG